MLDRFVNRDDAYALWNGLYWIRMLEPVTEELFDGHFAGLITIGMYHTNPDTQLCKWGMIDIDDHDLTGDLKYLKRASGCVLKLRKLGYQPMLEHSNGKGGYHIWLFFDHPALGHRVRALLKPIADVCGAEVFPKSAPIGEFGNQARIPGRHHTEPWNSLIQDRSGNWTDDLEDTILKWPASPSAKLPRVAAPEPLQATVIVPEELGLIVPGASPGIPQGLLDLQEEDRRRTPELLFKLKDKYRDEYELWFRVGMAVWDTFQGNAKGLSVWRSWSMGSPKYDEGCCDRRWPGFGGRDDGITFGSLVHWAEGGDEASENALKRLDAIHDPDKPEQSPSPVLDDQGRLAALEYLRRATRLPILQWIQRGDEAGGETYYLRLEGVEDEIRIGAVGSVLGQGGYNRFKGCVYSQARIQMKLDPKKWSRVTAHLALIVDVQRVEDETTPGRIRNALEAYIDTQPVTQDWDEAIAKAGKPFKKYGCLYVQVRKVVAAVGGKFLEPYKTFLKAGWTQETVNTQGTTRSYWFVALDSESIPAIVRSPGK